MPSNPKVNVASRLQLRVVAGAAQSGIAVRLGERLKLRVNAAPETGKANAAVEALIAETPGLHKTAVRIVAGQTSPHKTLEVSGMSASISGKILGRVKK